MQKANINHFAVYHLHYKEKLEITELIYNSIFFCPSFHLVSLPGILSDYIVKVIAIYHPHYKEKLVSNSTRIFAFVVWPRLVVKRGKPSKTFLYYFSHLLQLLSPLFSLTLFKICLAISKCLAILEYMTIFKWQFNLSLDSFLLLADYSSIKLTSEASLDLFYIGTKVKFSPDDNVLLNKQL